MLEKMKAREARETTLRNCFVRGVSMRKEHCAQAAALDYGFKDRPAGAATAVGNLAGTNKVTFKSEICGAAERALTNIIF